MTANRKLAAILAADVVGYSRLMEQDEVGTLAALKARRKTVFDPLVARNQGRIFKIMGDGVLVEFGSAVNAVQCAVDLQKAMTAANGDALARHPIVLRIGIALGDVVVEGGDRYGDGVNIAARLEGIAEPGGITVSRTIHDHVRNKINAIFDDLGPQCLKNITEPVHVYRIASDTPTLAEAAKPPDQPSIAVLPFVNMDNDPGQQYFSDGVTEDIITELSRFRSLFVIARNSSFQYRNKSVDVRRVARELGVRYVLEGSIRKSPERIRITAQLIDAINGHHLWSERYERSLDDLFAVQDEVVRLIAATLAGRLEQVEVGAAVRKPTKSLVAYDSLLRGIEHLRGYGTDDNKRARELFERTIALDDGFGLAHSYYALALLVENGYAGAPVDIKRHALNSALTGLRLESGDSRCHFILALVYLYRSDFDQALHHFECSRSLNPNDANCLSAMGLALSLVGRAEKGIELIRQAMRLNPFHPPWYWDDLAIALYGSRRYEEALEATLRIPGHKTAWHLARMAACNAQLGQLETACAQAAEVLRLKPDFRVSVGDLPYKNSADAQHVLEGMKKAGLPE